MQNLIELFKCLAQNTAWQIVWLSKTWERDLFGEGMAKKGISQRKTGLRVYVLKLELRQWHVPELNNYRTKGRHFDGENWVRNYK